MFAVFSVFFGVLFGGALGYYLIITKKESTEMVLVELKTELQESESIPLPLNMSTWNSDLPSETDEERLAKFKVNDTKDWFISFSEIDKEYLLTEYIKEHKNIVPYENVVGEREHLYPTMYFSIRLEDDGKLYDRHKSEYGSYRFNLSKDTLKELSKSVNWGSYTLRIIGGPYRVWNNLMDRYDVFNDIPLRAYIEVPLKSFSAQVK